MPQPILWYFADPMCSWCWGFAPVMEQVRDSYHDRLKIALVLGGLRPGTTEPMSLAGREETLHHWHQVHEHTGQSFLFEGALADGCIYDTEPASRAVACMADIDPALIFPMLKAAQQAFYLGGKDVTQTSVLVELAVHFGVDAGVFLAAFESDKARHRTDEHFRRSREWGIKGFPTLVLQSDTKFHLITNGWQSLANVSASLDRLLANLN